MEDSETRRERLKAMRAEAAQAGEASCTPPEAAAAAAGAGVSLANPLVDPPRTVSVEEEAARFDFYTDPMAAFSSNKKKSPYSSSQPYFTPPSHHSGGSPTPRFSSPRPGPRNYAMTPFPVHQMQSNFSPTQRMDQPRVPYDSTAPYRSPRNMVSPFNMHQGAPPEPWSGYAGTHGYYGSAPNRGMTSPYPMYRGNSGLGLEGSPGFNHGRGRAHWHGSSPHSGSGRGGSPSFSSGRGGTQWHSGKASPGFGWSSGRGRGFHSRGSVTDEKLGPECFYDKSMLEDPWQGLEPVLWTGLAALPNNLKTPGSSDSWLPNSCSMKKPRVSEPSRKFGSGQSLAEYLAAAVNEAVDDAANG